MTGPHRTAAELIDYWLAEVTPEQEENTEEHLLACAECTSRLEGLVALADGIRRVSREGGLRFVVSRAFLDRAALEGLRIRQYAPPAGGSVNCTVTAGDDLLIARLAADLTATGRVDLAMCDAGGNEWARLRDVPFDPAAGEVILSEPVALARQLSASVLVLRLLAVADQGERLLGEYTFNHSPSN